MNSRARVFNHISEGALDGVSPALLLDLFTELEELLKRISDTEDLFLRNSRVKVLSKLHAIKEEMLGE